MSLLVSGQTWPGRRGRDFKPPDAKSLSLVFEGQALDPSATVESTGLFFIHKKVEVLVAPSFSGREGPTNVGNNEAPKNDIKKK